MDILRLLDEIEEILEEGTSGPFSKKVRVDKEEILEIVSEIKHKLPTELKEAEHIAEQKKKIIEEAKSEADSIMNEAKVHIQDMVEESTIVNKAEEKAQRIIEKANMAAKEIRAGSNIYAEDLLSEVESSIIQAKADLDEIMSEVRENKKELKKV